MKLTTIASYLFAGAYVAVYQNGDLSLITSMKGITRYMREDNYIMSELDAEQGIHSDDAFTIKNTIFDLDGNTPIIERINSDDDDNFVVCNGTYVLELDSGNIDIRLTNSDGNCVYSLRNDGFFYCMEWDGITLVQEWDSDGVVRDYTNYINYDKNGGDWMSIDEWYDNSKDTLTRYL